MNGAKFVDVCVATYRRPGPLTELLESLAKQNFGANQMRIIVVDNDREESARGFVETFRAKSAVEVHYEVEPCQNISVARNRALQNVRAEYFAFLDDDETVSPDWLSTLLAAISKHSADVVFGPVKSILPPSAPAWAKKHPVFHRPRFATGTQVEHGGCGNVLIRRYVLEHPPQLFDPAYGVSGGEDTDFFYRLFLSGRRLIWCDEAEAHERVPNERVSIDWVCRRSFRGGHCWMRIFVQHYSFPRKMLWFTTKGAQLLGGVGLLPIVRVISPILYMKLLSRVWATAGQLAALLCNKFLYKKYDTSSH